MKDLLLKIMAVVVWCMMLLMMCLSVDDTPDRMCKKAERRGQHQAWVSEAR